jgi:hypothetical protein
MPRRRPEISSSFACLAKPPSKKCYPKTNIEQNNLVRDNRTKKQILRQRDAHGKITAGN